MKKAIILLSIVLFIFTGCIKVEDPTEHPFFVRLYAQFCPNCAVEVIDGTYSSWYYLFKDEGKEVDVEKTYQSLKDGIIVYTDGSLANLYILPFLTPIQAEIIRLRQPPG